jgi:two-component SAPR family response regulator
MHCGRRGATREQLETEIWAGKVSPSSLSRTLTTLKQVLTTAVGPSASNVLISSRDHWLLTPGSYQTDVQIFEHLFRTAERVEEHDGLDAAAPLYAQVLPLYGGPYMTDAAGEWSEAHRHWLLNSYLIAAERMAEYSYEHRRYHQCIAVCRQALAMEATAEEVYPWLFRAYAKLGCRADAARAYRRYLHATNLDPHSTEAKHDQVWQQYRAVCPHDAARAHA